MRGGLGSTGGDLLVAGGVGLLELLGGNWLPGLLFSFDWPTLASTTRWGALVDFLAVCRIRRDGGGGYLLPVIWFKDLLVDYVIALTNRIDWYEW